MQAEQRNLERNAEDIGNRAKRMEGELASLEQERNEAHARWEKAQEGLAKGEAETNAQREKILNRAVQTKTMPQGNKTNITEEEREKLGRWIAQGAKEK
mgnify:CR=1 FL=1